VASQSSSDPPIVASLLAAIVESSDDAIISTDLNSVVTSWNQGAERMYGYTAAEMVGTSLTRIFREDRHEQETQIQDRICRGERVPPFETRRVGKGDQMLDVSITMSPIRDGNGVIVGMSRISRDITALKAREREVTQLTSLYAALRQVNQAIVTSGSRDVLFPNICRALISHGIFSMAWIGLVDPQTRRLVPVASAGDDDNLLGKITVYTDDRPEGQGPSGTAIRQNLPYIANEMLTDPAMDAWRGEMPTWRFRSLGAFPIRRQHKPVGTLVVYAVEPGFFGDREVELLIETAGDISFALENFDREKERGGAEVRTP
jgi:PAS domain S-box-containing protein